MPSAIDMDFIKRKICYAIFSRPAHIVEIAWITFAAALIIALAIHAISFSLELIIGIFGISSFLLGASVSLIYNYDNVSHENRLDNCFLNGFWYGERTFASYLLYKRILSSFGHKCSREERDGVAELARRFMKTEKFDEHLAEWNCFQVVKKMKHLGFESYVAAYIQGVPIDDLVLE